MMLAGQAGGETPTGGVAMVVNIPDDNAALRNVAAGAMDGAREKWGLLTPPIKPEEVEACGAVDVCLNNLARDRGASHLFIVGVASLGEGEAVVSFQMFDSLGAELLATTDVLTIGSDPRAAGKKLFLQQTAELTEMPQPGKVTEQWPPPPEPIEETYLGLSALSLTGFGLVGVGALAATAALGFGAVQTLHMVPGLGPESRNVTALVAAPAVIGLVGVGLGLVAADLFVQQQ
jgi:hypothetical protein